MRVGEPGRCPNKFEFAARELLDALVGEVFDHGVLSRHDVREMEPDVFRADAPGLRVSRQVNDIGRVEQRLGGHAAAQDAKAADLLAAFDDDRFQAGAGRGAGRRVTAAAATNDGNVELEFVHA